MPSRRSLLRSTAAALGTCTLTSVAGCLDSFGADEPAPDDRSPTDTDTVTGSPGSDGHPSFTRWLPDPTSTPLRDGYSVTYYDVDGIRSRRESLHENAYEWFSTRMLGHLSTEVDVRSQVEATILIGFGARLVLGSFDPAAVGERITNMGEDRGTPSGRTPTTPTRTPWDDPETYGGFDLYGDGDDHLWAVSEDAVLRVMAPVGETSAGEMGKAIVDATDDGSRRYPDGNAYVDAMLGTVGDPDFARCYPEAMDGSSSRGFREDVITGQLEAWRFGADTTRLTFANTYPDAETATADRLRTFLESNGDRFDPYDGLEVRTDGRLVWTTGTTPTGKFDLLTPGGPDDGVTTPA